MRASPSRSIVNELNSSLNLPELASCSNWLFVFVYWLFLTAV